MATRAPPDPIEMSRLEQQAEAFEELMQQDPNDMQVGLTVLSLLKEARRRAVSSLFSSAC